MCAILQGKTYRCLEKIWEGASEATRRVRLYYTPKGKMNEETMLHWLHDVVFTYTNGAPAALIVDRYSSHFTPCVQGLAAHLNIQLIHIPTGQTATL